MSKEQEVISGTSDHTTHSSYKLLWCMGRWWSKTLSWLSPNLIYTASELAGWKTGQTKQNPAVTLKLNLRRHRLPCPGLLWAHERSSCLRQTKSDIQSGFTRIKLLPAKLKYLFVCEVGLILLLLWCQIQDLLLWEGRKKNIRLDETIRSRLKSAGDRKSHHNTESWHCLSS